MRKIGITTTIPQEIIYAADAIPVDLNNRFITSQKRNALIECAEEAGFGRNICAWIKGLYGVVKDESISEVIGVMQGDCSNTQALMETLQFQGVGIIPFSYPFGRDKDLLALQIKKLMDYFNVKKEDVLEVKRRLDRIRKKLEHLDYLTWSEAKVSGEDNHIWLVNSSDFEGDPDKFEQQLDAFLEESEMNEPEDYSKRLGFIGVPPIFDDIYEVLNQYDAGIVYNEVQRQFAMLPINKSFMSQYLDYTYPYDIFARIEEIKQQIKQRKLDGVVHYVQSFCFRQLEDIILRQSLDIPILTVEADRPGKVDARTKMRIEAFVEMI